MATNTYVAIDKKTIATSVGSVEFTNIPQTYTDLVIVANYGSTVSEDYLQFRFNSDSSTNYSTNSLDGNGSTARSGRSADRNALFVQWNVASENAITTSSTINVQNYNSTSVCKSVLVRNNRATSTTPTYTGTELLVGLWRKTPEAITTITVQMSTGSILAGSTFSLYGIAAVGATPTPKATGGIVYSDSTYYYHVFGSTGTFTPLSSLSADVLVVGTGGVGAVYAGGGGAGGSIGYSSGVSLASSTAYTATIGASGTVPKVNSSGSKVQSATASGNCSFSGGSISTITGTAGGNGSDTGAGGSNLSFSGGSGTGGGGAGFGANGSAGAGGAGGAGVSTYSSWGVATGVGQNINGTYYFAGGGGGGTSSGASSGAGGAGGGGNGGPDGYSGTRYTGGGGGGAKNSPNYGDGGAGGLGVVIVRYAKA